MLSAKEFVESRGAAELAKVAKMHFRTALRAQGLPEPPKTEWRGGGSTKKILNRLLTPAWRLSILPAVFGPQKLDKNDQPFRLFDEREDVGVDFCRLGASGWERDLVAHVAQLVEHVLGKDEVISSILIMGSMTI